jgi:alkylation response protein AidB-like acyl-CoA dehydrogenase
MDFELTGDQEMLREIARDFLTAACPASLVRETAEDEKGHSQQLWQEMAEMAMAKALTNEKLKRIATLGVQIHGAIGFTVEHDLPPYSKRAKAWEMNLGDTSFHLDRIAEAAGI